MNKVKLTIEYGQYPDLASAEAGIQALCNAAFEATNTSYSPYSGFAVGAAIRLADGRVLTGSNQENIAYPSGLCAERTVLFATGAQHPEAVIESMAVTARTDRFEIQHPVTSCGACLQVMAEGLKG